ncbi:MAG: flagellar motor switch protein FliM [Gammaproteobacteria bacterium]
MNLADFLSQKEIEALLISDDEGGLEADADADSRIDQFQEQDGIKTYDFSSQDRVVLRRHLQTLEMINDRFSDAFRVSLFKLLRRSPEIFVSGIQFQKFSEFMNRLHTPTNLNIVRIPPLRGRALIVMDSSFVFTVVDNYFGGNGQYKPTFQAREFKRSEMRLIRKILDMAFKDLKEAWKPVMEIDFDHLGSEINPNYAAIVGADDHVLISTVKVALEGGGGEINLLMPYAMIEPIKGSLDSFGDGTAETDAAWNAALRDEVVEAQLNLKSVLVEKSLSIRDLLRLKKGDVIPIEMPRTLSLKAEGIPVFTGKPCTSEGHYAVQISAKFEKTKSV